MSLVMVGGPVLYNNKQRRIKAGAKGDRIMEKFICSVQPCGFSAEAEKMWNLDPKVTRGKRVIVCGRDAAVGRRHGVRAFRLSETLKRDAEREAQRLASSAFFQAFKRAEEVKRGRG